MKLKLKELRKKYTNYTQEQMAQKLNVAKMTYVNWENDLREPNIETILKISSIFNCSIDELFGNDKTIVQFQEDSYNRLKVIVKELYELIYNLK